MTLETAISQPLAGETPLAAIGVGHGLRNEEFAAFYERTARPLWAYLERVSSDHALADDLLQESFIRFLASEAPLDGEVAARRYLFRIGTNLLRDYWRRPRTSALEELSEASTPVAADAAESADARSVLGPALEKMKPRERQLLWLAYAEGYSHREIAAITGLASASIRLLLFRARRRVAALLEKGVAR